jgi:hypothetical protein
MRDPALAALMGAIEGSDFGAEFGAEYPFQGEYGADYGADYGGDYGADAGADYGADYGADWGYEFGGPPPAAAMARRAPPPRVAAALWNRHQKHQMRTERRETLLEPNKGSSAKVERYTFSVNAPLVLGVASPLVGATGQPDTTIRPQRVTMNAPTPGFVAVQEIKVANVSVTVGGTADAFQFSALGVGQSLDMPTLSPANRASVLGNYSGFVPPGFVGGAAYSFTASFTGPATIVA